MIKNILYVISLFIVCYSSLLACAANGSAQPASINAPSNASSDAYPQKTGKPYVIKGVTYYPLENVSADYVETGIASWYGNDFHGKKTANGEIYDMYGMTAAHKTLPLPTFILVKHLDNGREVVVRINDRGPFSKGRILDLSYAAAKELDMLITGTARVQITVLSQTTGHLRTEGKDVDINKGAYVVQIGSFLEQNNADRLAAKYNAIVRKTAVNAQMFHRVQLRGYRSRQEAEAAAKGLENEFPEAFVMAE